VILERWRDIGGKRGSGGVWGGRQSLEEQENESDPALRLKGTKDR